MWNKPSKSIVPKQLLFRLTFMNIIVIATFIALSSWAIYNTACILADGLTTMTHIKQAKFESTLFQYLLIFSISTILISSVIHFYLTKRVIHPLQELIQSTKRMRNGYYPKPMKVKYEDEIGELIIHFNDLVKQLKDNEQHRQKLIADLSHEFRTPLTNLNGYLKALKSGVIQPDEDLYQSLFEETSRLIKLVEQMELLKEWNAVTEQTFSEKTRIDMKILAEESSRMFRWSLKEAGIKMDFQVESGFVHVQSEGISQVLNNFIDNAIRYYQRAGNITVEGKKLHSEYMISVIGPGEPIPMEEHERIFQRFYRLNEAGTQDKGGTGLGLAISKEIIEHHNGRIGAVSDGNIHTFWFTLPLV